LPNQFIYLLINTSVNLIVALTANFAGNTKSLLFFAILVPMAVFLRKFFHKKMELKAKYYRSSFEDMSAGLSDMLTMIPVTRAHGVGEYELFAALPEK